MFTRGAYLDEMQKQNDVLKKKGIKLQTLNIKIPNNDKIKYPWQDDFKRTAFVPPPDRNLYQPPNNRMNASFGDFDYLGGKMGGTLN